MGVVFIDAVVLPVNLGEVVLVVITVLLVVILVVLLGEVCTCDNVLDMNLLADSFEFTAPGLA